VWTSEAGNDTDRVSDLSYSYASPGSAACAGAPATGADTALRWKSTGNRTGKVTTYCYDRADRLVSATTPGRDTWAYIHEVNGSRTETRKNGAVVQSLTVDRGDQITTAGHVGQRRRGGEGHGLRSGRQSTVTVQCSVVWPWRSVRLTGPDTIMVLQSGVPSGPHPWASRSSHDSAAVLLCNTQPG
jgi:YD repeat-containing protein